MGNGSKTHISRSESGLMDILETDAFDLTGLTIHCTFSREKNDLLLRRHIERCLESGLLCVKFTNGERLENKKSGD